MTGGVPVGLHPPRHARFGGRGCGPFPAMKGNREHQVPLRAAGWRFSMRRRGWATVRPDSGIHVRVGPRSFLLSPVEESWSNCSNTAVRR